jgi:hypothetical protein
LSGLRKADAFDEPVRTLPWVRSACPETRPSTPPMNRESWSLAGFGLYCAALGASLAFLIFDLFRGLSIEAAANVLVALGTFALAYFTYQSIRRTSDVISGEDRRQQQSLAPLLELEQYAVEQFKPPDPKTRYGFRISNIGFGLALNVELVISGRLQINENEAVPITDQNRMDRRYSGLSTQIGGDQGPCFLVPHKVAAPYEASATISAIAPNGSTFQEDSAIANSWDYRDDAVFKCVISYEDMFGNPYKTAYLDPKLISYTWEQPEHFRLPRIGK